MTEKKADFLLFFSWAVSVIAVSGSLYFSEIRNFVPCDLCWFQRIFMYPLVIILATGYVKKDWNVSLYSMALSGTGAVISIYHYYLQKFPRSGEDALFCGQNCTGEFINWFGFITIPLLALTAFVIIFIVSFLIWKGLKEENER